MSVIFDTLEYVKGAEKVHIPREQAEYQAQQLAALIHNDVASKHDIKGLNNKIEQTESSLKHYVEGLIKSSESTIIKWMIGISFTQFAIVVSVMEFLMKH